MTAISYNDTAVVDKPWDGPGAQAALPNDAGASVYRQEYTYVDPSKDADTKAAYKLPHHEVANGKPGAANVNGCRNALSRLPQTTGIPQGEFDGIRSHLNKHIAKFNKANAGSLSEPAIAEAERHLRTRIAAEGAMRCWAAREELAPVFADLTGHLALEHFAEQAVDFQAAGKSAPRQGSIAVLSLKGTITPQPSLLSLLMGGDAGGLQGFANNLRAAVADPDVKAVVLDIDSPGGLVDQVPETAALIRAARDQKPVVAVANTMAASAAYWLASQANELVVTPSGEVGSIGVFSMHLDRSGMLSQMGVKPTIIRAGKYKAEGNPYQPLTQDAEDNMQEQVDDFYGMFVNDVAKGRQVGARTVESNYGQGRTMLAQKAVDAGMADRVATLSDTVTRLQSSNPRIRRTKAELAGQRQLLYDDEVVVTGAATNATAECVTIQLTEAIADEQADAKPPMKPEELGRLLDSLAQLRGITDTERSERENATR